MTNWTNWTAGKVGDDINFRFLHPLLGQAKSPTRSVSIFIGRTGHPDFIWSFWEVAASFWTVESRTGDKHQPHTLDTPNLSFINHTCITPCTQRLRARAGYSPVHRIHRPSLELAFSRPRYPCEPDWSDTQSLHVAHDFCLRRWRPFLISTPAR